MFINNILGTNTKNHFVNTYQVITLGIAIWGAVTGSIALFLRARAFLKDRPKLKVNPKFEFSYSGNQFPPDVTMILKVANSGRRPASVDKVIGEYKDGSKSLLKYNLSSEVSEGKAVKIRIGGKRFPDDKNIGNLKRVQIIDQTGKVWKSKKSFYQGRIKDILESKKIKEDRISNNDQYVDIKLYKGGKRHFISTRITKGNHSKFERDEFLNSVKAESVFEDHIKRAKQLINGETEEF